MDEFVGVTLNKFDISPLSGFYKKSYDAVAVAAAKSVKDVSQDILQKGRASIAASGKFRGKWLSGLRARYYPKKNKSANAKAYINHRFGGLASVHEFGATIKGRPLLWLPMPGAPKTAKLDTDFISGRFEAKRVRATPANVSRAKGALQYVKIRGERPMLGYTIGKGKRQKFKPLYIGVPSVRIKAKWKVTQIASKEAERLSAEFLSVLNAESRKDG